MASGIWVQYWEESERGWGTRPDGCWLYATEASAKSHTQLQLSKMRAEEAKIYGRAVPDEYSRPVGQPQFKEVTHKLARRVEKERKLFQQTWI